MLSSRLSVSALIELCRVLRHYLGAGLSLVDVFRQQARRGPATVREMAGRVAVALENGAALEDALKAEKGAFPPLFLSLASVGERTGSLPEVCHELERYYGRQQQMRRQFLASIAWPVFQLLIAVFVLSVLIWVFGQFNSIPGRPQMDPLGLGLSGTRGVVIFLGIIAGAVGGLVGLYLLLTRVIAQRERVDRLLLGLPLIGPCLHSLALGRFCLALRLTTESGMSIGKAVRLSLRATGHQAYEAGSPAAEEALRDGEALTLALGRTRLFPEEFLHIVNVAEESGQLTEVLRQQGEQLHDEATRRLAVLNAALGYLIWAGVGLLIIIAIFRLYVGFYLGTMDQFMPK